MLKLQLSVRQTLKEAIWGGNGGHCATVPSGSVPRQFPLAMASRDFKNCTFSHQTLHRPLKIDISRHLTGLVRSICTALHGVWQLEVQFDDGPKPLECMSTCSGQCVVTNRKCEVRNTQITRFYYSFHNLSSVNHHCSPCFNV